MTASDQHRELTGMLTIHICDFCAVSMGSISAPDIREIYDPPILQTIRFDATRLGPA